MTLTSSITPIFVLGSARNGTTWLGNLLCAHPQIAGAHHQVHWGQQESNLLACLRYAGDLTDDRRFIRFLELFASSDYFQLVGGEKERFYRQRPRHFFDFYLQLMDRFAQQRKTPFWVTKLDPRFFTNPQELQLFLGKLERRYQKTRWISVKRPFPQVLSSYLNMEGRQSIHQLSFFKKHLAVCMESARYPYHYRAIDQLIRRQDGLALDFESLKKAHEETLNQIGSYLGLDQPQAMKNNPYRANSSYLKQRSDRSVSPVVAGLANRVMHPFFRAFPFLAKGLLRMRDRSKKGACPYYWRLLRLKHMPERFKAELQATGQTALHDLLFGNNGSPPQEEPRTASEDQRPT